MKTLEQAGVSERTLVVFTSDNGTTPPGPLDADFHICAMDAKFFDSVLLRLEV